MITGCEGNSKYENLLNLVRKELDEDLQDFYDEWQIVLELQKLRDYRRVNNLYGVGNHLKEKGVTNETFNSGEPIPSFSIAAYCNEKVEELTDLYKKTKKWAEIASRNDRIYPQETLEDAVHRFSDKLNCCITGAYIPEKEPTYDVENWFYDIGNGEYRHEKDVEGAKYFIPKECGYYDGVSVKGSIIRKDGNPLLNNAKEPLEFTFVDKSYAAPPMYVLFDADGKKHFRDVHKNAWVVWDGSHDNTEKFHVCDGISKKPEWTLPYNPRGIKPVVMEFMRVPISG